MSQGPGVPVGKQAALTVSNVAVGLTPPSVVPAPQWALVTVENNPIRYWADGSTPTAANGHLLSAGDSVLLEGNDEVRKFLAIRQSGVDAVLQATFGWY